MKTGLFFVLALTVGPVCVYAQAVRYDRSIQYVKATCDGSDAAPAIRAAIATGAASVVLPPCPAGSVNSYYTVASIDTTRSISGLCYRGMFWLNSGQTMVGQGSKIMVANGALLTGCGAGIFLEGKQSHVTIENLIIDMNGARNLATSKYKYMIGGNFQGGSYNTVKNCTILNDPGQNAIMSGNVNYDPGMSHFTVTGNLIENGGTQLPGNTAQTDWSAIYAANQYSIIQNNRVIASSGPVNPFAGGGVGAGGIEVHNSNTIVSGNTLDFSSPGIWISNIDGPGNTGGDLTDVTVSGNIMKSVLMGVEFSQSLRNYRNIDISGNTISIATIPGYRASDAYGIYQPHPASSIYLPGSVLFNSSIANNVFVGTTSGSIGLYLDQLNNVSIKSNVFTAMDSTGIWLQAAPQGVVNTTIQSNTILDAGTTPGHGVITLFYNDTVPVWRARTAEAKYQYITPTALNNHTYVATTAGTSGATQPTWPTTVGATVSDGTITWTCESKWQASNLTIAGNTFSNAAGSPPGYSSLLVYARTGFSSIAAKYFFNVSYGQRGALSPLGSAYRVDQKNSHDAGKAAIFMGRNKAAITGGAKAGTGPKIGCNTTGGRQCMASSGIISVVTGASPAAGNLANVSFSAVKNRVQCVVSGYANSASVSLLPFLTNQSATGFSLYVGAAPAASKQYYFAYVCSN